MCPDIFAQGGHHKRPRFDRKQSAIWSIWDSQVSISPMMLIIRRTMLSCIAWGIDHGHIRVAQVEYQRSFT